MITRYDPKKDYPIIQEWYRRHNLLCPPPRALSDTGWIADNRVAAWLYITPSSVALIDGLISNPETVPSLRKESIDKLTMFIVDYAMLLGYTDLIAMTRHPNVAKTAERLGFRQHDYKVFILNEQD